MAIDNLVPNRATVQYFTGISTDTKPTPNTIFWGSYVRCIFYETDTSNLYEYNGVEWVIKEIGGALSVADFYTEVKKGNINRHSIINKFGAVTSTGSHTSWKPVCTSETYFTPTAAVALEAISDDNVNDTAGGTGALTVRVYGLKLPSSTAEETEDIILNGTTAVALANSWWRIYRSKVIESGTYAHMSAPSHNSIIDIREVATPANIWAQIVPDGSFGFGQSLITAYTIPTGIKGHLISFNVNISDTNGNVHIAIFARENADDVSTPFSGVMQLKELHKNKAAGSIINTDPDAPILSLTGPADVGIMCRNGSNQAYDVDAEFQLLLVNE